VKSKRLRRLTQGALKIIADGGAAGKIREADAIAFPAPFV
jgi:hypothetical protein